MCFCLLDPTKEKRSLLLVRFELRSIIQNVVYLHFFRLARNIAPTKQILFQNTTITEDITKYTIPFFLMLEFLPLKMSFYDHLIRIFFLIISLWMKKLKTWSPVTREEYDQTIIRITTLQLSWHNFRYFHPMSMSADCWKKFSPPRFGRLFW